MRKLSGYAELDELSDETSNINKQIELNVEAALAAHSNLFITEVDNSLDEFVMLLQNSTSDGVKEKKQIEKLMNDVSINYLTYSLLFSENLNDSPGDIKIKDKEAFDLYRNKLDAEADKNHKENLLKMVGK